MLAEKVIAKFNEQGEGYTIYGKFYCLVIPSVRKLTRSFQLRWTSFLVFPSKYILWVTWSINIQTDYE